MYVYNIRVMRVIDGDTVEAEIDLGFNITYKAHIRVAGVNCPEIHGKDRDKGRAAKDFTDHWLSQDYRYWVKTAKPDKYGRVLGAIMRTRGNETEILAQALLKESHAIEYMVGQEGFTEQVIP